MKNTKRILSLVFSVALVMCVCFALSSCNPIDTVKGWFGGGECQHTFSEEWSSDATNHWHAATCEHKDQKSGLAAHADANADGKCDTCAYAMSVAPDPSTPVTPVGPKNATYTVTVKNSKGEAVEGVYVIIRAGDSLRGDYVPPKATDAEGKISAEILKASWFAQIDISKLPEGYDSERVYDEETKLEFVKKYEFDENNNVTITLLDAVVEDEGGDDTVTE